MAHQLAEAIQGFWQDRRTDWPLEPTRSSVTSSHGRLEKALAEELAQRGIDPGWIRFGRHAGPLPAFHGAGHRWDIVVAPDEIPLAAITITVMPGNSAVKNRTNRIQELVASAFDVRKEYGSPDLDPYQPFLGLFFLLEDTPETSRPRKGAPGAGYRDTGPSAGVSVKERWSDVFEGFLKDELYDGICYVTAAADMQPGEPHPSMGIEGFLSALADHVKKAGERKDSHGLTAVKLGELLSQRSGVDELMSGFTSTRKGLVAAEAAVIRRRRELIAELRRLALSETVNETVMQKALAGHYWLFGGQYVGVAERRDLMPLQQHDIPLISSDQSVNIIELKGPEASLVRKHNSTQWIVTSNVHEAVAQCMNYLRTMDEQGSSLRTFHKNDLGVDHDYRRARATVIIGHPDRSGTAATRETIEQTIRTYNAHLSRIQVLTYADLLDSAERALNFEELAGRSS